MGEQKNDKNLTEPPNALHPIEEQDTSAPSSTNSSSDTLDESATTQETQSKKGDASTHSQTTPRPTNINLLKDQNQSVSTPQEQPKTPLSTRSAVTRQPTESGSLYYGSQPQQETSIRYKTQSRPQSNRWPSHSLAGSTIPDAHQPGSVYIDPEYQRMNPRYGGNNEKPVWGLAKPLPRVVRPGMRRDGSKEPKAYGAEAPGESQPAPELGATPGIGSPGAGEDRNDESLKYSTAAQRGLAKKHAIYAPQADGILRPMESEAEGGFASQEPEQLQTEEAQDEFLNSWVKCRHYLKEPFAEWLAVS